MSVAMRPAVRPLVLVLTLVLGCAPATTAVAPPASTLPPSVSAAPTAMPSGSPSATPTVAGMRIVIRRLGIDLPIEEGDVGRDVPSGGGSGSTPEGAAFHFPGTAVPGNGGNSFIYAHARIGMFLTLWQAVVGDDVEILTRGGTALHYRVSQIHPSVPSSDVSWVAPTADDRLTLQTSTGPTPAYPRFIVVAIRA